MIVEFNVDSKAECDQLNLAHETVKLKQETPIPRFKICEDSPSFSDNR